MISVLDHGFVRLVETWGSDERIIEAARMSTAKGFLGWGPVHEEICASLRPPAVDVSRGALYDEPCNCNPKSGDEKLLRFLYENKHATPFEMAGMTIKVQAPIFVFREWHRHRTQSYNEMSARYMPLPDVNYIPTVERLMMNAGTSNKQAGTVADAEVLTEEGAREYQALLKHTYNHDEILYRSVLRMGVPKELARIHLPVGRYSRMMVSTDLRNWLAFLTLRMAPNAQWEIRQFANAVGTLIERAFPRTWKLFDEGMNA